MNELMTLAADINEQHRLAEQAVRTAIEHALQAGELLLQVKQDLPHGRFTEWVQDNCEFSDRSARGYMRLARELPKLEDSKRQHVATLPLRSALYALADHQAAEDKAKEELDRALAFEQRAEATRAEIHRELDKAEKDMDEMDRTEAEGTLDTMAAITRLAEIIPYATEAEKTLRGIRLKGDREATRLYKQAFRQKVTTR